MKQKVANYTVVIGREKRLGTNQFVFTALVPLLGIATEGDTLEEVQKEIKSLIEFHLQALADEGEEIPDEKESSFVTKLEAVLPKNARLAY
ncbi:hypothetical protein A3H85_02480 [Candidatus Daviesbacteria bacterium RIFCSPLOWO2_02_FULL_40_8]|uniref:HicB-like antitoxin of toxin-antitoxin system domain-containing protein n=1 Tax=Candidatus Daviesbacteria bacterium RIFCSPLOWO2_01_FULL_40_24 TaxID=1797787 RepID=A0A1F5MIE4_9BACT|nr:MAG: hypothetical protein A2780_01160 [Candidatus Daviesbacteria bacterium RIFCSPHIGHO2_01_FULL_41_45]OGE33960.1 MAG: hypothetical protein A3C32_01130 [Candidatus Daviesbacteria bacterium RIFCSPHIGHO2_02_FULL_41_14]OGE65133.1 MAG: hypothetical protein A3B49_03125 [Candidatus Daviesbacteria bacterium RIFCSPLOWO2_01_FULL_40_24]OGE67013.1 MAG: hypothetical protein A3H85_02480 [Candidatus Daviesbacteria bacterium RIFCSPLOWO2_02_FULL_40_8]